MQAKRQKIDPATAIVTLPTQARLGDYSSELGGFPVSLFAPDTYLPIAGGRQLHFRNAREMALYPVELEAAKRLRARIGANDVIAELTLEDIRPSNTRSGAYDGHVTRATYFTRQGEPLLTVDAAPESAREGADSASGADAIRTAVTEAAGLPPLGATWAEAQEQFMGDDYYYVVTTAKWYPPSGPEPVYIRRDGAILTLQEPDADQGFRVYLQPVEIDWGQDSGVSVSVTDVLGHGGLDTDGLGAGLNCGTPDVKDRCAVLRFEPAESGHIMTAAWGIIELPGDVLPDDAIARFGDPAALDTAITQLGYEVEDVRIGRKAPRTNGLGVTATMALAGAPLDEAPVYDPLSMTTGETIPREIEIFVIEGAEGRTPVLYNLSR
uniref:hypothetical protein n=1 Tax=Paracoccus marcusii TaxID=59779 RepID=UPI00155D8D71|nr:hypothetical protein [Paracoccus marcusii]